AAPLRRSAPVSAARSGGLRDTRSGETPVTSTLPTGGWRRGRVPVTDPCRKLTPGHSHSVGVAARAVQPGAGRPAPVTEGVEPMGRGRAKAKQTRVARELKYSSPNTDLTALQRELAGQPTSFPARGG